jgi:hypothetical protein
VKTFAPRGRLPQDEQVLTVGFVLQLCAITDGWRVSRGGQISTMIGNSPLTKQCLSDPWPWSPAKPLPLPSARLAPGNRLQNDDHLYLPTSSQAEQRSATKFPVIPFHLSLTVLVRIPGSDLASEPHPQPAPVRGP